MTKEEMLYIDIPIEIEVDREIEKYFKDRKKREKQVIKNQNITDKFKNIFNKDKNND